MNNKISNTITISFKSNELHYLIEFKRMYAVPTAIIKDFIINTVIDNNKNKGINNNTLKSNNIISNLDNTNNNIDLLDF